MLSLHCLSRSIEKGFEATFLFLNFFLQIIWIKVAGSHCVGISGVCGYMCKFTDNQTSWELESLALAQGAVHNPDQILAQSRQEVT